MNQAGSTIQYTVASICNTIGFASVIFHKKIELWVSKIVGDFLNGYDMGVEELIENLQTDSKNGLTQEVAENRLREYGTNLIPEVKGSFWQIYLAPLFNILITTYLIMTLVLMILAFQEPSAGLVFRRLLEEGNTYSTDVYITKESCIDVTKYNDLFYLVLTVSDKNDESFPNCIVCGSFWIVKEPRKAYVFLKGFLGFLVNSVILFFPSLYFWKYERDFFEENKRRFVEIAVVLFFLLLLHFQTARDQLLDYWYPWIFAVVVSVLLVVIAKSKKLPDSKYDADNTQN